MAENDQIEQEFLQSAVGFFDINNQEIDILSGLIGNDENFKLRRGTDTKKYDVVLRDNKIIAALYDDKVVMAPNNNQLNDIIAKAQDISGQVDNLRKEDSGIITEGNDRRTDFTAFIDAKLPDNKRITIHDGNNFAALTLDNNKKLQLVDFNPMGGNLHIQKFTEDSDLSEAQARKFLETIPSFSYNNKEFSQEDSGEFTSYFNDKPEFKKIQARGVTAITNKDTGEVIFAHKTNNETTKIHINDEFLTQMPEELQNKYKEAGKKEEVVEVVTEPVVVADEISQTPQKKQTEKPDLSNWHYSKGYSYEGIYGTDGAIEKILSLGCEVDSSPTFGLKFIRKDDKIVGMIGTNATFGDIEKQSFNVYLDNIDPENTLLLPILNFPASLNQTDVEAISEHIIKQNTFFKTDEVQGNTTVEEKQPEEPIAQSQEQQNSNDVFDQEREKQRTEIKEILGNKDKQKEDYIDYAELTKQSQFIESTQKQEQSIIDSQKSEAEEPKQAEPTPTPSASPSPSPTTKTETEEKSNWIQGIIGTVITAVSGLVWWNDGKKEEQEKQDNKNKEPEHKGFPFKKATVALCTIIGAAIAIDAGVNQGKWCSYVKNSVTSGRSK